MGVILDEIDQEEDHPDDELWEHYELEGSWMQSEEEKTSRESSYDTDTYIRL